ncbi:mediator complex, subunit Med21 [Clohesyomyces aquaticus]|uniref:Mediator of RNA polymerase II transcription subunit 21 n=1 Tax=Clohesyomyces aquaticus TaxID=1231657 RepID=A0A1Y2A8G8_9PLEO|nr:mediator complex, subunit Med21 [Clohesyomyces aquaticus]
MADILTQIQDELDMLLHQMASVLSVIKERAPSSPIPGQPVHPSLSEQDGHTQSASHPTQTTTQQSGSTQSAGASTQQTQQSFTDDLKELSRDLVLKEQQIELLISRLPGVGTSQKEQMERMKEVEKQLEDIERERNSAVKERAALLEKVENLIGGVGGMG